MSISILKHPFRLVLRFALSLTPSLHFFAPPCSTPPHPVLVQLIGQIALLAFTLPAICLAEPSARTNSIFPVHAGPIFERFSLVLAPEATAGVAPSFRTEALGPLFYSEQLDTQRTWAIPPLLSYTRDPVADSTEFDLLYPVITYDCFGSQYRFQIGQLFSIAGGASQTETDRHRFTLFPIYFQQRSSDPKENYTAVFPFYGRIKNRLFRDEIFVIMFPLFAETREKGIETDNYLYPLFHLRYGDHLTGWQLWPIYGTEHKDVTTRTNGFGDVELVPGYDHMFVMGPFFFNQHNQLGTEEPQWAQGSLPFYDFLRTPKRDSTTVLWPLFSWMNNREKKYREWHVPWPFLMFARGEGKHMNRFFPFFSQAHAPATLRTNEPCLESNFYLWPVYKYNHFRSEPLDRQRTRILFFLFSDTVQKHTETKKYQRRTDLWPLFTYRREFDGSSRLQAAALLESYLTGSKSIERDYSPLWSFWRAEKNPRSGASSQSLLWNLYRHETLPHQKTTSAFFGCFQYQSTADSKELRLFYFPVSKHTAATPQHKTSKP